MSIERHHIFRSGPLENASRRKTRDLEVVYRDEIEPNDNTVQHKPAEHSETVMLYG